MNRILFGAIAISALVLTGCSGSQVVQITESDSLVVQEESTSEEDFSQEQVTETTQDDLDIFVYVCGHVNNPGVYQLTSKDRIFDAINAAGGILDDGNGQALAQAEHMTDGMTIYVPGMDEEVVVSDNNQEQDTDDGLIDINKADEKQLMTIPGIGERKAQQIIEYRNSNGPFQSIEDLKGISGIKDGVFNKIKDYIKVS